MNHLQGRLPRFLTFKPELKALNETQTLLVSAFIATSQDMDRIL